MASTAAMTSSSKSSTSMEMSANEVEAANLGVDWITLDGLKTDLLVAEDAVEANAGVGFGGTEGGN